jgi:hypothetical protein
MHITNYTNIFQLFLKSITSDNDILFATIFESLPNKNSSYLNTGDS